MVKRSKFERAKRAEETERARQIETAWFGSLPAETRRAFVQDVEAARARGPLPPQPDMAPGTAPNPPRPGFEPKVPKDKRRPARRSY
jgi:hypothetical protein